MRHRRRRAAQRRALVVGGILVAAVAASLALAQGPSEDAGSAAGRDAGPRAAAVDRQPNNVYAAATSTRIPSAHATVPERVYVPNSDAGTLDVIDPRKLKVVDQFTVGSVPHHVTPAWDLKRLYVNNTVSNSLTVIDPRKAKPVDDIPVEDPYNLYFTPDGKKAIVVAERLQRLDIRDPKTWELERSIRVPWLGVDHLDFSADGSYLLASCEFSGIVAKVDLEKMKVADTLDVGALPIDVKLSPDGEVFYVANQGRSGVSVIDPERMKEVDFLPTGEGAHGLHVSRDARRLYVSNRLAGSISVIDLEKRKVADTWEVGGYPDMLQISPDGRQLWASSRYDAGVLVVDTKSGKLIKRFDVGAGAHGISYFPQPGRFSVGHNGVYR